MRLSYSRWCWSLACLLACHAAPQSTAPDPRAACGTLRSWPCGDLAPPDSVKGVDPGGELSPLKFIDCRRAAEPPPITWARALTGDAGNERRAQLVIKVADARRRPLGDAQVRCVASSGADCSAFGDSAGTARILAAPGPARFSIDVVGYTSVQLDAALRGGYTDTAAVYMKELCTPRDA